MQKIIKPSWVLTSTLKEHNNLFLLSGTDTNYLVDAYSCKCGLDNIVVKEDNSFIYICPKCNNSEYMDIESISKDIKQYIENMYFNKKIRLDFSFECNMGIYDNQIRAIATTKIPYDIDFIEKKILYKDLVLDTMGRSSIQNTKRTPFSSIHYQLNKLASKRINFEDLVDRTLPKNKFSTNWSNRFSFVCNHYNLKDFEFMKWTETSFLVDSDLTIEQALSKLSNNKSTKLIKKLIFANYTNQLDKYKKFNPILIHIITLKFTDINHIAALLKLDFKIATFRSYSLLLRYIDFLLKYYNEKQIVYYFQQIIEKKENLQLFSDTLLSFQSVYLVLNKEFEKTKCSVLDIHDKIVHVYMLQKYISGTNKKLIYSPLQLSHQVRIAKYNIRLPKNESMLYIWADLMHNCLASYVDLIKKHHTTVYGFFINDKLLFVAEISKGKIIQAFGKYNRHISGDQRLLLNKWLNEAKQRVINYKKINK